MASAGTSKPAAKDSAGAAAAPTALDTAQPSPLEKVQSRLKETVGLIQKSVETHDDTLVLRALRRTTFLRKQDVGLTRQVILKAISKADPAVVQSISAILPASMEIEETSSASSSEEKKEEDKPLLPEVELYLHHLAVHIAKTKKLVPTSEILQSARLMISRAKSQERRTMDVLRARAWLTFAIIAESVNGGLLTDELRDEILASHRESCLKLDEPGQAVTINLILRDLVSRDLVAEAAMFASKAKFPDRASNNMQVRHLYYISRIEALQLEYGKSLSLVQQAIRKTPTTCGRGFRLRLYQLATVVTLLTGETPERAWFSDKELGEALTPYFDLVKAVRVGQVQAFEDCVRTHQKSYARDRMLTLVHRLYSSVIKTGLKSIGAAYSRISFADVAHKLQLKAEDISDDTTQAALYLCAKAVRDGVLDAAIDSDKQYMCSQEQVDVYSSSSDPQRAYQKRINFLLQVHNDAVKGLRFPPDAHKPTNKPVAPEEREDPDLEDLEDALADDE